MHATLNMSAANVDHQPELAPAPGLPDYLASPNAVLKDTEATWRYGRPPDYSKTRKVWAESKSITRPIITGLQESLILKIGVKTL